MIITIAISIIVLNVIWALSSIALHLRQIFLELCEWREQQRTITVNLDGMDIDGIINKIAAKILESKTGAAKKSATSAKDSQK